MSEIDKTTTSTHSMQLPDYKAQNKVVTQFGMRYPDGTIKWDSDALYDGAPLVQFRLLAEEAHTACTRWDDLLNSRSQKALVDRAEYEAGHQLIKRSIMWAVTEAENAS